MQRQRSHMAKKKSPSDMFSAQIIIQQVVKPYYCKNNPCEHSLLGFSVMTHMRRCLQNKAFAGIIA